MPETRRSPCPIAFALDLFGDRWTLLIIRDMAIKKFSHFNEFLAAEEGISTNILADRLTRLEAAGLVTRKDDPDSGRRKLYRLTDAGIDLVPVLMAMIRWSARYDPETAVSDEFRDALERDFEGVTASMRAKALEN